MMTGWEYLDASAAVCGAVAIGGLVFGGAPLLVAGVVGLVMISAATVWIFS